MTAKGKPAHPRGAKAARSPKAVRILLVDQDEQLSTLLQRTAHDDLPVQVKRVTSMAEARQRLAGGHVDLAVIDAKLPDGSGLQLAQEVSRTHRLTKTIVITEKPDADAAIAAMRAGVSDFLIKPLDLEQINKCVHETIEKQSKDRALAQRVRRLRRLCKKLNQARIDVSHQVDILCNDLVTAYQELASQMQQVVQTSEYAAVIKGQLDLEMLLRQTLEYLIEKAGPTNVAVFLPASIEDFTLGGYVNYDCTEESADMLLDHLADVVAPKISQSNELVHITDNLSLYHWIGDDASYLAQSHVVAFTCCAEDEALAVVIMFRDGSDPFDDALLEVCAAVAPLLGEALAKVIRVHHRHLPDDDFDDDDNFADPYKIN